MDNATALRLAQECFPDDGITKVSLSSRARLWAGMGNIYEARCSTTDKTNKKKLMVKYIHPRLPKSGQLSIGDQRKLDSYLVEANFYEFHAKLLLEDHNLPLPPPMHVERHLEDKSHPTIIICMGELLNSPSTSQVDDDDVDDIHTNVVKWLAKFHAATWHKSPSSSSVLGGGGGDSDGAAGVQGIGSYWHLETRPSEHADMPRYGWEGRLKRAASAIDARLKRDPLECWVHGDTKDANILYTSGRDLAFCDFQYTGRGPPSRDLSYYFCSSHVDDLDEQKMLLDIYYQDLIGYLTESNATAASGSSQLQHTIPTRQQLDDSMELAFADFCRFMAGWGYWGYDLSRQVKATLDKLDGGKMLKTEDDYEQAVQKVFG